MKEIKGNLWDFHKRGEWVVIPTNCVVNKYGEAVMGAGLAQDAVRKFPAIKKKLGRCIREGEVLSYFPEYNIIALATKRHWKDPSILEMIENGCVNLQSITPPEWNVFLPRLGCGNGRLRWEIVRPSMNQLLDDRFTIVDLRG
jgi:hypothetical protein